MSHRILSRLALLGALMVPCVSGAQAPTVLPAITRGLVLLQADSVHAAVQTWSRGWTSPEDSGKAETIESAFESLKGMGGRMRGFDVIATEPVTPHLVRVYVLLRFSLPVYAEFAAYDRGDARTPDWIVATVRFNTDPLQALPSTVWHH